MQSFMETAVLHDFFDEDHWSNSTEMVQENPIRRSKFIMRMKKGTVFLGLALTPIGILLCLAPPSSSQPAALNNTGVGIADCVLGHLFHSIQNVGADVEKFDLQSILNDPKCQQYKSLIFDTVKHAIICRKCSDSGPDEKRKCLGHQWRKKIHIHDELPVYAKVFQGSTTAPAKYQVKLKNNLKESFEKLSDEVKDCGEKISGRQSADKQRMGRKGEKQLDPNQLPEGVDLPPLTPEQEKQLECAKMAAFAHEYTQECCHLHLGGTDRCCDLVELFRGTDYESLQRSKARTVFGDIMDDITREAINAFEDDINRELDKLGAGLCLNTAEFENVCYSVVNQQSGLVVESGCKPFAELDKIRATTPKLSDTVHCANVPPSGEKEEEPQQLCWCARRLDLRSVKEPGLGGFFGKICNFGAEVTVLLGNGKARDDYFKAWSDGSHKLGSGSRVGSSWKVVLALLLPGLGLRLMMM